jgi:hypothetical protein
MPANESHPQQPRPRHNLSPTVEARRGRAQYALAQECLIRSGLIIRDGRMWNVLTRRKMCCGCAARFTLSTRWRAWARSGCGRLLQTRALREGAGRGDGQPGGAAGAGGLKAIYVSGWQVAADANNAGQMYPDQSLYPADSVPNLCRRINSALQRADQVHHAEGKVAPGQTWFAPLVADAEAGFGGTLNAFELMKAMIEAGAACVHFEDQLSSAKKCGHLGGKVLVPTSEAIQKLVAARLAADVMGVPTLIMARTDADSAHLLTSDIDARDRPFAPASALRRVSSAFGAASSRRSLVAWPMRLMRI